MVRGPEKPVYFQRLEKYPKILSAVSKMYGRYLGFGLPPVRPQAEPADRAELEWATGVWDYLGRPHELGRYSLLAGYYRYFAKEDSRILDIGCGEGLLRGQLEHFSEYVGVDISPTAVKRAGERWHDERTSFLVGDVTMAPGAFDVIFANEILQVLPDPDGFAQGVFDTIGPGGGYFLVSIHHDTPRNPLQFRYDMK